MPNLMKVMQRQNYPWETMSSTDQLQYPADYGAGQRVNRYLMDLPDLYRGKGVFGDYVPGGFAIPQNPLWDGGMGDFVPGRFSIPQNPVGRPSSSLPMAPALTQADINGKDCGCGGSCESCGGMGAFDMSSFQHLIPGQTFGISNTYLVGGALLALFLFRQKRGRR